MLTDFARMRACLAATCLLCVMQYSVCIYIYLCVYANTDRAFVLQSYEIIYIYIELKRIFSMVNRATHRYSLSCEPISRRCAVLTPEEKYRPVTRPKQRPASRPVGGGMRPLERSKR